MNTQTTIPKTITTELSIEEFHTIRHLRRLLNQFKDDAKPKCYRYIYDVGNGTARARLIPRAGRSAQSDR